MKCMCCLKSNVLFHPNSTEQCVDCQIGQLSCWEEDGELDFAGTKVLESLIDYRNSYINKMLSPVKKKKIK